MYIDHSVESKGKKECIKHGINDRGLKTCRGKEGETQWAKILSI